MRDLLRHIHGILLVPLALYWVAALLLLNLADIGLVRSAALAWELPWLEKACLWFCLPMLVCTIIGIGGILIHKCFLRCRTRREARQIIDQMKSAAAAVKTEAS